MPDYAPCPQCGAENTALRTKVPVARGKHFLDYITTLECRECGNVWCVGGERR